MSAHEKALVLIESVRNALTAGTEHYDVRGKRLTTVKEVIEALNNDGEVELRPKNSGLEPEIAINPDQIIKVKPRRSMLEVYKRTVTRLKKKRVIDV